MEIYRTFDKATRSITSDRKAYGGQVFDSNSTRVKFTLQNEGQDWDFRAEGYRPFIVFNVFDANGNPYVYGEETSPAFSGYEFTIPYEITSQAPSLRVEYQLWFVAAEYADSFNGTPDGMLTTTYILSAVDGIAFRQSCIKPPKPGCGCRDPGFSPALAPTIAGPLEFLRSRAIIRPVENMAHINDEGKTQGIDLIFKSLSGEYQEMWLNVPLLSEDGKLGMDALPTGNAYGQIPLLKSSVGTGNAIVYDGASGGFIAKAVASSATAAQANPAALMTAMASVTSMEYVKTMESEAGSHFLRLLDGNKQEICHVDLPLESMIKKAYYDASKKALVFEVDGAEEPIVVPVHDLIDLYQGSDDITIEMVSPGSAEDPTIYRISLSSSFLKRVSDNEENLARHKDDISNPHRVTKAQVGLGNVENISPANMPVSDATSAVINDVRSDLEAADSALSTRIGVLDVLLNGDGEKQGLIDAHIKDVSRIDLELASVRGDMETKASKAELNIAVSGKQDKLIAGANIGISDENVISYVGPNIDVDDRMSATSTNPVQNRVVVQELDKKQDKLVLGTYLEFRDGKLNATVPPVAVDSSLSYTSTNPVENRAVAKALDLKANIGEGVSVWKGVTQGGLYMYNSGDVVVYDNALYISKVDNNDHHPDDETCWAVVQSGAVTQKVGITPATFIGVFGNETDTLYTVTHNLASRNLVFSFMRNDGSYQYVYPTMVASPTLNTIRVQLPSPPGKNKLCVNIIKARTITPSAVTEFPAVINFTTPDSVWEVYNDSATPLYVKAYNDAGEEIEGDVTQDSISDYSPVTETFESQKTGKLFLQKADAVHEYDGTKLEIPVDSTMYCVQCYRDGTGQCRPDMYYENGKLIITSDIAWTGTVALYKASKSKTWKASEMVQLADGTYEITYQHNLGRVVGAQVWNDEMGFLITGFKCLTDNKVAVTSDIPFDGTLLVI